MERPIAASSACAVATVFPPRFGMVTCLSRPSFKVIVSPARDSVPSSMDCAAMRPSRPDAADTSIAEVSRIIVNPRRLARSCAPCTVRPVKSGIANDSGPRERTMTTGCFRSWRLLAPGTDRMTRSSSTSRLNSVSISTLENPTRSRARRADSSVMFKRFGMITANGPPDTTRLITVPAGWSLAGRGLWRSTVPSSALEFSSIVISPTMNPLARIDAVALSMSWLTRLGTLLVSSPVEIETSTRVPAKTSSPAGGSVLTTNPAGTSSEDTNVRRTLRSRSWRARKASLSACPARAGIVMSAATTSG